MVLNKFNDFIIKTIGFLILVKYIGSETLNTMYNFTVIKK
jgi:hypothetical protein